MRNTNMLPAGANLTPQQKASIVNAIMGNPSIQNQQGTSRVLYDTLPMDGRNEFRFFENVSNRTFPFTNLNQNRLQVGETFALMRLYLTLLTITAGVPSEIVVASTDPSIAMGEFSIYFDTMQVVKPIPVISTIPQWNHSAAHVEDENFRFDNNLILPTDVQFRVELDTMDYNPADPVVQYLRCTLEGFGTILSPKNQF